MKWEKMTKMLMADDGGEGEQDADSGDEVEAIADDVIADRIDEVSL